MRRYLIIGGVLLAAVLLLVLVAPSLINIDRYRPQIQARLESELGRKVTLGPLTLKVIPLSATIESLTIAESPLFPSTAPFASASNVRAAVQLLSLLRGEPVIDSISMTRPTIELIHNADGNWNFASLGSKNTGGGGQTAFTLNRLTIEDGQVALTDHLKRQPRAVYDHIDLDLRDFAPGRKFGIKLAAHLPGAGNQVASFDGEAGPWKPGDTGLIPIDGAVSLQSISLAGLSRFMNGAIPPDTDTVASGKTDIKSEGNVIACKGDLRLEQTVIRGHKLDYPIQARYDVDVDRQSEVIQIRAADLKVGDTPLSVKGRVESAKTPANLDLQLSARNAAIGELARLAGAAGVAFHPKYQFKGNITADLTARGPSTAPQLAGTVSATGLEIGGGDIKQTVSVPQLSLALSPEAVRANPFTAQSGATRLTGSFTLSQYTSKNMNIDAALRTGDANIAELIDMAKAYGIEAAEGMSGSGRASADVRVQGPISDPGRLVYSGTGAITGATLSSPALAKPINIARADLQFAQNAVSLDNLDASAGATKLRGKLSVANFAAPNLQFNLSSDKIDGNELRQLSAPQPAAKPGAAPGPSILERTTGTGTVAIQTLVADTLVLNNVRSTVKLNRGVIELSPLTADLYGGKQSGSVVLDTRPTNPVCTVRSKLTGLDAEKVLSSATSVKDVMEGLLAADSNLSFALGEGDQLTRTLNGTLDLNMTKGRLKHINLLQELGTVGRFLGIATGSGGGGGTAINKLAGRLNLKNGIAATDNLVATLNEGSLAAKGNINLVSNTLDMRVNAVLANAVSQAVGGSSIGGFLSTVLANNKGELVIPVRVTGSLAKPSFAPDAEEIGRMKVSNLLPTSGDPSRLSSAITNAISGKGGAAGVLNQILGGGQQQPSQQKSGSEQQKKDSKSQAPANPVQSIFDAIRDRKKKQ